MAAFAKVIGAFSLLAAGLGALLTVYVWAYVDWSTMGDQETGLSAMVLLAMTTLSLILAALGSVAWLAADLVERRSDRW